MMYYIIYPKGILTELDIAQAFEYEKDDYALASRESFSEEFEAIPYAIKLAEKNDLKYVGRMLDANGDYTEHKFLD